MPHLGRNTNLKAKPENNPSRFTREKAQRTLDEVRKRYGIRQWDPPAHPTCEHGLKRAERARETTAAPLGEPRPPTPKTPFVAVERMRPRPHPSIPTSRPPSDNRTIDYQTFHYLIRIAECALTLHCEVTADSEAAARHHVKQIPNLMEWREISGAELAEILKNERDRSKEVKPQTAQPRNNASIWLNSE
jgi:hypothetical protein